MPKWFSRQRLFLLLKRNVWLLFPLISIIQFFGMYGKFKYEHIPEESVNEYLYKQVNPNLKLIKSKPDCKYVDILQRTKLTHVWEMKEMLNFTPKGITNGSYTPEDCNPVISVAILVTYRNRQSQLDVFIPYMHTFLRKQNIHYKIYVIEQQDDKPWNKGLLYNIGAKQAIAEKFPCLILHDVDLLPLDDSNLYACLNQPRHMSASIDKFRFVLIYKTLVGGVLAITSEHYKLLNGFSNRFQGWGGEDDDFACRISANKLDILSSSLRNQSSGTMVKPLCTNRLDVSKTLYNRLFEINGFKFVTYFYPDIPTGMGTKYVFPQHMARYTMLRHKQEPKNTARYAIMRENKRLAARDGLSSVAVASLSVKQQRLYTLVTVRV